MRLTIIVAVAALLTPVTFAAQPAAAPGLSAAQTASTDISAASKKKRKAAKTKTEQNLKAAPSEGKSTY